MIRWLREFLRGFWTPEFPVYGDEPKVKVPIRSGRGAFEPRWGPLKVRIVRAYCSERLRIVWTMADGTQYQEYHTCPPQEVIDAHRQASKQED